LFRRRMFGISPGEVCFATRGFSPCPPDRQDRLERVGSEFLNGYHAAMETNDPQALAISLGGVELEFRGFAYEGAAMAWTLLDHLTPWRRDRFQKLLDGPGHPHLYMIHVGAGWAVARLPWLRRDTERACRNFDPLSRWLVLDGYGFHQGYFHWPAAVTRQIVPPGVSGYARRAFDQGLGRSLWFVGGADVERILALVGSFSPKRHSDLYAGLGLACGYAGGVGDDDIARLHGVAGAPFAQGIAFAAKARQRAGNPAPHTERACRMVWRLDAAAAAAVTDRALPGPDVPGANAYEIWRQRIQEAAHRAGREACPTEVKYETS
jgi:hypothetical protein